MSFFVLSLLKSLLFTKKKNSIQTLICTLKISHNEKIKIKSQDRKSNKPHQAKSQQPHKLPSALHPLTNEIECTPINRLCAVVSARRTNRNTPPPYIIDPPLLRVICIPLNTPPRMKPHVLCTLLGSMAMREFTRSCRVVDLSTFFDLSMGFVDFLCCEFLCLLTLVEAHFR